MTFSFKNYTAIRNGVFLGNSFDIKGPDGLLNVTSVITARRYTTRHKSDVKSYIENSVKAISKKRENGYYFILDGEQSIETMIKDSTGKVDPSISWDLLERKGESEILNEVAEGFYDERDRECVVSISKGYLTTEYLKESIQNKREGIKFWYDTAIDSKKMTSIGLGRWWDVNLFLKEGKLPKYNKIILELMQGNNNEVIKSFIDFDLDVQRDILRVLKPAYQTLKNLEVVDDLLDSTNLETQRLAYKSIIEYKKRLEKPYIDHLCSGGLILNDFILDEN